MKYSLLSLALLTTVSVQAAELLRIPPPSTEQLDALPKNVAQSNMGSVILSANGLSPEAAARFLSANLGNSVELPAGQSEIVLDLGQPYRLSKFSLISVKGQGNASVSFANAATPEGIKGWKGGGTLQLGGEESKTEFPMTETRFVRLQFNLPSPATVSGLSLEGDARMSQTSSLPDGYDPDDTPTDSEASEDFDFASLFTGAQVAYVNGGEPDHTIAMIDDDISTGFPFPQGDESILVVDIGFTANIYQTVLLTSGAPGTLEIYHFPGLPKELAETAEDGRVTVPPNFFDNYEPNAVYDIQRDNRLVQIVFNETKMRYIIVRRVNSASGSGDGAGDDPSTSSSAPFIINEVSVIGKVRPSEFRFDVLGEFEFQDTTGELTPPSGDLPSDPSPRVDPISQ